MKPFKPVLILILLLLFIPLLLLPFDSVRAEFGTNWTAEYFDNRDLSGSPEETVTGINGINFDWGDGRPTDEVDEDDFSARFSSIQTFSAGTYEFVLTSDDGARVYIDGVLVLDRFVGRAETTDRFTQTLIAGSHSLIVEYFEGDDQALISFQWFLVSAESVTGTVTDSSFSTGPTSTPGPTLPPPTLVFTGPTATLFQVKGLALRTGPYTGATLITVIETGRAYGVDARSEAEGVYPWYRITTTTGRVGWASGRYLNISVDPNELPFAGSVFDDIGGAPETGVTALTRTTFNLRPGPSDRPERTAQVVYGETVQIIGRTVQAGFTKWYQVRRVQADNQVGWISATEGYLEITGDIRDVPVR
jgi:uncharacterized protein YraI